MASLSHSAVLDLALEESRVRASLAVFDISSSGG